MNDVRVGLIQIDGLRDLEDKLKNYSNKLAKNLLQGAIREGAKVIQKECQNYTPKSKKPHLLKGARSKFGVWIIPGNLKKMIRVKVDKSGTRGYKISYEVYVKNKEAWYWKFVEFGTSKMYGRTFMRSGFEMAKEAAIEKIDQYLRERLGEV